MRLAGKSAVVTGAAQGIGEACARRFAEEGAGVVCVDVNAAAVDLVAAEIVRLGWARGFGVRGHLDRRGK